MAGIRESTAKETLFYKIEPQVLAQICQDVLKKVGKVKSVSRETGVISGKVKTSFLENKATIILRISRKDDVTELSIQTSRGEAILSGGGAQKGLVRFMTALGADERLKGKSGAGW